MPLTNNCYIIITYLAFEIDIMFKTRESTTKHRYIVNGQRRELSEGHALPPSRTVLWAASVLYDTLHLTTCFCSSFSHPSPYYNTYFINIFNQYLNMSTYFLTLYLASSWLSKTHVSSRSLASCSSVPEFSSSFIILSGQKALRSAIFFSSHRQTS